MNSMKKMIVLVFILVTSLSAFAVEDDQVAYVGGSVTSVKEGTLGRLDTTQETLLIFEYPAGKLNIPFAKIESFQYNQERARHLGVLPTIAIGLFKHLQRRHFFRISYRDESNVPQVALFEVPKQMPPALLAVLQTRAQHGCKPQAYFNCGRHN